MKRNEPDVGHSDQETETFGECDALAEDRPKYNLQDRLIEFASSIIGLSETLPPTPAGNHVAGQLLRSGTSPAPNYGEAQSAESRGDFIHKMKIALKELRETYVWLRIILERGMSSKPEEVEHLLKECDELIRIFMKSIATATGNLHKSRAAIRAD